MMRRRPESGLTLVELIVAMAIFSVMGLFLFTLMSRSLGIYRSASRSAEFYDKFDTLTRELEDDLRCVWIGDPEGQGPKSLLVMSHDRQYVPSEDSDEKEAAIERNSWPAEDPRSFALRFVRTYPGGELSTTVGRFAGTYADQEAYIDGVNDDLESRADEMNELARLRLAGETPKKKTPAPGGLPVEGLKAPRGLMEVLYFIDRGPSDAEGSYTLYRAVRSPVGGAGSFLSPGFLNTMTPEWIAEHGTPVVSGLAHFGLLFWSQNTVAWETERSLDFVRQQGDGRNDGAESWWDSTRARYAAFGLHRGAGSGSLWEDDVFPSRVQLVMTFVREGLPAPESLTAGPLGPNARRMQVTNPKLFDDWDRGGPRYLRVDDEWMEVVGKNGSELELQRGIRRTQPLRHESGQGVTVGRRFTKVIEIPAHRSWFAGGGQSR